MDTEKRMAGEYEITQSILIGDKEVVFGINENNPEHPYLCAFYESNDIMGRYNECMISNDYIELMLLYAKRITEQCENLREAEQAVTVPRETITADMCFPISHEDSIRDKVIVIRLEVLRPEYRSAEHQLAYVISGFGAEANSRGNAVFIANLYTGKESRIDRGDVLGIMKDLPDWAKKRENEIRTEKIKEINSQEFQSR